ncbi:LysR family transcriptional regulator [Aeromonas rivuli]|uniref:LysR family transcriptional regulator n=1 Tax=Aeromonas rivuli TaxID=648794 RepID=UPI001CCA18D5|nr:LysR family transcriptional regulator [Aeromonas rivuli]UBO75560.1 LysR family transcriptional regulator [Aeromonas rivuli]
MMLSREIDYFLLVCDYRNIAKAADELGMSQSALTRAIQRLESQLGTTLFVRTSRGVEPTPVGEVLRKHSEHARVAMQDAEHEITQMTAGLRGRIRIGVGQTLARHISQRLLSRLIHDRPGARIQIQVAFSAELFELVEAGALDFAVTGLPDVLPANLLARPLTQIEMCVVVRSGHPLTKIAAPGISDLLPYRSAAPRQDVHARRVAEQILASHGSDLHHVMLESNSWETMLETVSSTDLFTLAPWYHDFEQQWAGRLQRIDIPELTRQQTIGLVQRQDAYVSSLAERAMALLMSGEWSLPPEQ